MRTNLIMCALLALGALVNTGASAETMRFCKTDVFGTRTCHIVSVSAKTDRIMGISAKQYERGVRAGKCMPSPSGACGGG